VFRTSLLHCTRRYTASVQLGQSDVRDDHQKSTDGVSYARSKEPIDWNVARQIEEKSRLRLTRQGKWTIYEWDEWNRLSGKRQFKTTGVNSKDIWNLCFCRRRTVVVTMSWWTYGIYRLERNLGHVPMSYFAITNSWFVNRNHGKQEVFNSGIHLNHNIWISDSYFTVSKNGTTCRKGESCCSRRFSIPFTFSETEFTD
jgi:hypothetical protein